MDRATTVQERARRSASVADARTELATALGELRGAVRERLDWRGLVRAQPIAAVAIAAVLGFSLGRGRRA